MLIKLLNAYQSKRLQSNLLSYIILLQFINKSSKLLCTDWIATLHQPEFHQNLELNEVLLSKDEAMIHPKLNSEYRKKLD
jgi:hypothetical protein